MEPVTAIILAAGALLMTNKKKSSVINPAAGSSRGSDYAPAEDPNAPKKGDPDRIAMAIEIRRMSLWYSSRYNSMPLLADYLTVVAFIESRFGPSAINPEVSSNPENAARGLFGMRPRTAFRGSIKNLTSQPNLLLDPKWAFVTALHGVWSACNRVHSESPIPPDWASVRRWWASYSLASDFGYEKEHSKVNTKRLLSGIEKCNNSYGTNINPSFINSPVMGWGNFPGMDVILQDYGLGSNVS